MRVKVMSFSPTGTTQRIMRGLAEPYVVEEYIDFTQMRVREHAYSFQEKDVLMIGVPVYAGRVPNILLPFLKAIKGNGTLAVPLVVYGNRHYDDALIELCDLLQANGFQIFAAAAFIGEHSFSKILAKNRPDDTDMAMVSDFSQRIYHKWLEAPTALDLNQLGNRPYRAYYQPLSERGEPVDLRRVKPNVLSTCNHCLACVALCPMGAIDARDTSQYVHFCIKCGACIKKCPKQARHIDDEAYVRHKQELEEGLTYRRQAELFL